MAELNGTIYQFSDWKNAVKIKNELNPNIKIDVLELQDDNGYILTIFENIQKTNKHVETNILYRVPVECPLPDTWSLSSTEAVSLLNSVGFPCAWISPTEISAEAREQLQDLKEFGWANILRFIRPAEVRVLNSNNDEVAILNKIIPNFNYKIWEFLTVGIPTPIEGLLDNTVPEPEE